MKKSVLYLLFFFGATLAGPSGCLFLGNGSSLELSGTLELTEHSVGSRVPGRIVTLSFDEGQTVTQGQVLATLDRFDQAQKDYERVRRQVKAGGASEQLLEQAALNVEDQRVTSPVDGVVLTKVHEAGEIVGAGGAIAVIGDRSRLWVRVFVPEGVIGRVRLGQSATVLFDGSQKSQPGKVIYIAPRAEFTPRNVQSPDERVTQTFAVKIAIDHPDPELKPGIAANVTIPLEEAP